MTDKELEQLKDYEECTFSYKCPLKWEDLKKTDDEDVRFCTQCMEDVYLTPDLLSFKARAKEKKCVAIQDDEDILMGLPVFKKNDNPA